MGYEIMVFSVIKFNSEPVADFNKWSMSLRKLATKWVDSNPFVIFDALAEGMGMNAINISLHKKLPRLPRISKRQQEKVVKHCG